MVFLTMALIVILIFAVWNIGLIGTQNSKYNGFLDTALWFNVIIGVIAFISIIVSLSIGGMINGPW